LFNRSIQVRLAKNKSKLSDEMQSDTFIGDSMYVVNETTKSIIKGIVLAVAAYVVLDTARQVIVNYAPKN
jgi:hypothetical protein